MFLKNVVLYEIYSKKSQWPNTFGTSLCIIKNKFVIFHSFTIPKLNLIFYKVIFNTTILISNIFPSSSKAAPSHIKFLNISTVWFLVVYCILFSFHCRPIKFYSCILAQTHLNINGYQVFTWTASLSTCEDTLNQTNVLFVTIYIIAIKHPLRPDQTTFFKTF